MSKVAEDLVRFAGFLQTLGVAPLRGRLKLYSDVLAAAAKGQPVDRDLLWAAACEVSDLEEMTTLSPASMGTVVHRLPGLFGGAPVALAAAGDDAGRSLTFELVTGARLQKIGGTSGFGVPSDVTNQIAGVPLMVECKRPTSLTGMAKRLQEGFRQLSEHRRAGHAGLGAIAIEASALVNPESGVLVDADPPAMLYRHLLRILAEAKDQLARAARNARKDAQVHLLMLRVKCIAGDGEQAPDITQVWHLEPLTPLDSPEFAALYQAMQRMPGFTPGVHIEP
jgi:hypothetical protein